MSKLDRWTNEREGCNSAGLQASILRVHDNADIIALPILLCSTRF